MVFNDVNSGAKGKGEPWRDNYRTPDELLELVRNCLGHDYFDPCPANPEFDGLAIEWQPNTFINPPFSQYAQWVAHGLKQPMPQIWLANNATETKWFQLLANKSHGICFLNKRVTFIAPEGVEQGKGNPRGQVLFYRGGNLRRLEETFASHGIITIAVSGG